MGTFILILRVTSLDSLEYTRNWPRGISHALLFSPCEGWIKPLSANSKGCLCTFFIYQPDFSRCANSCDNAAMNKNLTRLKLLVLWLIAQLPLFFAFVTTFFSHISSLPLALTHPKSFLLHPSHPLSQGLLLLLLHTSFWWDIFLCRWWIS